MYYLNPTSNTFVKFDLSRFLERSEEAYDIYNAYFLQQIRNLPVDGVYRIRELEHRPDAVSEAIYGDSQYWWVLMEYNNFSSWLDFTVGTLVNFFSLLDLETLFLRLKTKQQLLDRANRVT